LSITENAITLTNQSFNTSFSVNQKLQYQRWGFRQYHQCTETGSYIKCQNKKIFSQTSKAAHMEEFTVFYKKETATSRNSATLVVT
jgi:hypothetical protein